jgi:hypothetical protein
LLFREKSREGDDVGVDVLLSDRRSAVAVGSHDCDVFAEKCRGRGGGGTEEKENPGYIGGEEGFK